jgi:shikimate kinase
LRARREPNETLTGTVQTMRPQPRRYRNRAAQEAADTVARHLGERSIVMVGLMGCGKTSVGRRLAARLGLNFVDADHEIEMAAGKTIPEIFADHGEPYFRDGERKVIARLLETGPQVLATGGGAFMNAETRRLIATRGISIWLKADLDILVKRVSRRTNRPLLKTDDPAVIMKRLIGERYPVYAEADITVESREVAHEVIVSETIAALAASPKLLLEQPSKAS